MVSEIQVVNDLERYFNEMGFETQRGKYSDFDFAEWHDRMEIDLKIRKANIEIPIEVKSRFDANSIQRGIGQALLYLIFYDETWLAVPFRAIELLEEILRKTQLQKFKVLDWENKELYEYRDGKVIANKL